MKRATRKELAVIEEMREAGRLSSPYKERFRFVQWNDLMTWSQDAWLGIARWHLAQLRRKK